MIAHDALVVARRVYGLAQIADQCARDGNEARARVLLAELASIATAQLPILEVVIAAQEKAAQACDGLQWTPQGFIPLPRRAEKHLHVANDEHPCTPSEPTETIA